MAISKRDCAEEWCNSPYNKDLAYAHIITDSWHRKEATILTKTQINSACPVPLALGICGRRWGNRRANSYNHCYARSTGERARRQLQE